MGGGSVLRITLRRSSDRRPEGGISTERTCSPTPGSGNERMAEPPGAALPIDTICPPRLRRTSIVSAGDPPDSRRAYTVPSLPGPGGAAWTSATQPFRVLAPMADTTSLVLAEMGPLPTKAARSVMLAASAKSWERTKRPSLRMKTSR